MQVSGVIFKHAAPGQDIEVANKTRRAANTLDLSGLLGSWELHLRAERKPAQTLEY